MTSYFKNQVLRAPWEYKNATERARHLANELTEIVDILRRSTQAENHPEPTINIDAVRMLAHHYNVAVGEIEVANEKYKDRIEVRKAAKP